MRRYWSQAMMLLLGISLTVGFYEGRHLVRNTAKALTVATTKSPSGKRGNRHREDRVRDDFLPEEEEDFLGAAAKEKDEERLGKRRKLGGGARALLMDPELSKAEKINLLRMRQRQRLMQKGELGAPRALPKEEELVDSGLEQPQRMPDVKLP